ncbi:MAG: DUF1236 domain-containing protein [Sagittula sp.]|jgi:uncharacterized protein YraI|uniref:DUF1236 domain-containing protein n=1 Tax=unclassified Sagittula TaxID=2624628 RepID=UPI000C2D52B0|nr:MULTISPECIES: DUF1236 domain-containing protein [unclassified Sagittula]AUC55308.1 hypothetical protein CDO87_20015 [Sagittula sp. P11]WHZ37548.1 DUF1236 domain-containing protein [Sagittula sp. MA-2]
MFKKIAVSAIALTAVTAAPLFALEASTTTELNLRQGPGPQYGVVSVMPQDAMVTVDGCTASDWCKVTFDGAEGWAYSPYLINTTMPEPTVIYQNTEAMDVQIIEEERDGAETAVNATAGAGFGAATAALLVGGPAAVAAGVVLGAAGGAAATPEETTVTYVSQNPVEPVYLNGEVVVGAGIPEGVTLYDVPEADYTYAYVNDAPVIVNPENRRIVYVVR